MTPKTPAGADNEWAEVLTGQMLFAGLLGKLWYQCPDRDWYAQLLAEDVFGEAPFAGEQPDVAAGLDLLRAWQMQLGAGGLDAVFDELAADYAHLFLGPGALLAPPWESVYFNDERLVFQVQTSQVRAWYRRFGLEAANDGREPEDHIGLELAFVAHLSGLGLTALEAGDDAAFTETLEALRAFLNTHLLKWAPAWCRQVEAGASTAFYQAAARITRGVLAELSKQPALVGAPR